MQVWWKGAMSAVKTVSMSVPQGSVIAPLFFNIIVHDVVMALTGKVAIAMYADDLAIWLDTHIRRLYLKFMNLKVKKFMNLFQAVVDGVVRFMKENGFTLSSPKTVFIPFHTNNLLNQQLHVKINEECIFASNQNLSVMFSRQGWTHLQVDNIAKSASRALNVIKVLSAQPWANSPKSLVSLVRRLTRLLGVLAHSLVYREAGVLPLGPYVQLSAVKYKFRCQTVTNSTVHEAEEFFRGPAQVRFCSSICDSIRDLIEERGWMRPGWRRGPFTPTLHGCWRGRTFKWA